MELSAERLFRPKWSNTIHEEWIRNLLKKRPDLDRSKLERTREMMNTAIPDCLVEGFEELIKGLKLPDEKDRHVLAAAIHSSCDAIITFNLRHFPVELMGKYDIEVQHPDDFIYHQFGLNRIYFGRRSFSSSGSSWSLTQRRSARAHGSLLMHVSKAVTRRVRSSGLMWQWW